MVPIYLRNGVKFKINDIIYRILKIQPNKLIEVFDENYSNMKTFTQDELIRNLCNGELKFEVNGKNIKQMKEKSISFEYEFQDIENLKHKEEAKFRYGVIKPLLDIPYNIRKENDRIQRAIEINKMLDNPSKLKEVLECDFCKKVSAMSIYRWLKDYEDSNCDIRALVPSYHRSGGKSKMRIAPQLIDFINDIIKEKYLNSQRTTMKDTYLELVNRISEHNAYTEHKLKNPSFSTFARYISKISEFELISSRLSKRDAEQKFSIVGKGVKVNFPLERVEIDHTELDIMLISEDGNVVERPYLVTAIDKFSRNILGFSIGFGSVGWPEVMQCIRHIMTDKSYIADKYPDIDNRWTAFGIPKKLVIDNGKEFKNKPMIDACLQLGIVLQLCPPRVPEWKGSIERFFGTANTGFIHTLPGTTRSNPQKLAEGEKPAKKACITFSLFLKLIHKWIVDVYIHDLNRGAGGIPAKIWDKAINEHPVAWPSDITELAIALGRVVNRQIHNTGIHLNNLRYNSLELNKLLTKFSVDNNGRNQKFKIKYDPFNLAEIYLYDHLIEKRWIKIPSVCPEYTNGLTEWEHKEASKRSLKEIGTVDIIALAKAKADIQREIEIGTNYSNTKRIRLKKTNSTTEIYNNKIEKDKQIQDKRENDLSCKYEDEKIEAYSLDIGKPYLPDETDTSVVMPISEVAQQDTEKRKKKSLQKSINNCSAKIDKELSEDFLKGFGVISNEYK